MLLNRVRDLREDNDYKQKQLADYLCVKQSTYSDYENDKINIPIEALIKLSHFYNVSVDYLLNETDIKKPYPKKKSNH